ncbi:PEP-CTERM sorting domain-containing protein [Roseateles oligotrophus]|uniref:PEP-CTERM sorting domain-containing protein n=1 Tax=Roseateles oligotrophus TaxID=1769250 RepID=A0ABT2YCT6_9BURK|nr:PEP-CTERM sorting domain-containing protein [Roseateles oligotrophus]MCV2367866.1 PEP-CTERM sorting domain-containing protein [Roseateles oligotrophus]
MQKALFFQGAASRASLGGLLLAGLCLPQQQALAQAYEVIAYAQASAYSATPPQDLNQSQLLRFNAPDPRASQVQVAEAKVLLGVGGNASAHVSAGMGVLKAYADAGYAYHPTLDGLASSNAQAGFYDTVKVNGAGLAPGTPVSYRVDLTIEGTVSHVLGALGSPFAAASATALLRVLDTSSNQSEQFEWNAASFASGVYSVTINTQVGHELYMTGNLNLFAQAKPAIDPLGAHFAVADFGHTLNYTLAPSVTGLNTVGMSGHEFLAAAVPEPAQWLSLLAGLVGLAWRRRAP